MTRKCVSPAVAQSVKEMMENIVCVSRCMSEVRGHTKFLNTEVITGRSFKGFIPGAQLLSSEAFRFTFVGDFFPGQMFVSLWKEAVCEFPRRQHCSQPSVFRHVVWPKRVMA